MILPTLSMAPAATTVASTPATLPAFGFGKRGRRHCKYGKAKKGTAKGQCLKHKRRRK